MAKLRAALPLALQIPLLNVVSRHEAPHGLRVPQSGWMHEPKPGHKEASHEYGPVRNTFRRTHRWAKVLRDEDELAVMAREDKLLHVLFSTIPDDLGLYDKPMARNVQLWTDQFRLLLDGPAASGMDMKATLHTVEAGGMFGYRFVYPAMRVGRHEVYWHRPLVAWLAETGHPAVLPDAPMGYLTAYRLALRNPTTAVELWPRLLRRELPLASVNNHTPHAHQTARNIRKLVDASQLLRREAAAAAFARSLLAAPKHMPLEEWLEALPAAAGARGRRARGRTGERPSRTQGRAVAARPRRPHAGLADLRPHRHALLRGGLLEDDRRSGRGPLSQQEQRRLRARRRHAATWRVTTTATSRPWAITCWPTTRRVIAAARHDRQGAGRRTALPLAHRFRFPWMGGWLDNQDGAAYERNLVMVIPGRDRSRAVIMADHYDTAYMDDRYEPQYGGNGARAGRRAAPTTTTRPPPP